MYKYSRAVNNIIKERHVGKEHNIILQYIRVYTIYVHFIHGIAAESIHANTKEKIKRIFFPIRFNELVATECLSSILLYIYIKYICT